MAGVGCPRGLYTSVLIVAIQRLLEAFSPRSQLMRAGRRYDGPLVVAPLRLCSRCSRQMHGHVRPQLRALLAPNPSGRSSV